MIRRLTILVDKLSEYQEAISESGFLYIRKSFQKEFLLEKKKILVKHTMSLAGFVVAFIHKELCSNFYDFVL